MYHCLGAEEMQFKLPDRMYTAKAYSDDVKLYKIDINVKYTLKY